MPRTDDLDQRDALALVRAAEQAVGALQSIRSRLSDKRDATAATGHLLASLLQRGGTLHEYARPKIWSLRHALGGEGFHVKSAHAAAAVLLATLVAGLEGPRSRDEAARAETANGELGELAKLLVRCDTNVDAIKALEQFDQGTAQARAAAHKLAHEERLARSAARGGAALTQPAARAPEGPKPSPLSDGDFPLPGSADAGDPTLTVG